MTDEGRRRGRPRSGEGKPAARKSFLLRLSPALMEELKTWSGQEFRSLNGHIEFLLADAVKKQRRGRDSEEEA